MTDPDRDTALTALNDWARSQARARPRLVAAAWQAGAQNVAELARAAQVRRDTIYADLRTQGINYQHRRDDYQLPTGAVYGLPDDWEGERHLEGGYGQRPPTGRTRLGRRRAPGPMSWHGLSLLHRNGPCQLTIDSRHHPAVDESPRQSLDTIALQGLALAMNLTAADAGETPNPRLAADLAEDRGWERVDIPIDGAPTPFHRTAAGPHWAAYGSTDTDTDIILTGINFPLAQVRLARLDSLDRYLPTQQQPASSKDPT